jgi:hypothetical protein
MVRPENPPPPPEPRSSSTFPLGRKSCHRMTAMVAMTRLFSDAQSDLHIQTGTGI